MTADRAQSVATSGDLKLPPNNRRLALRLARFVRRKPLGAFGALLITVGILLAVFAPVIAPQHYSEQDLTNRLASPSWDHPFGTDSIGSDVLAQVAYGARLSLGVAFAATVMAVVIATTVGIVSGYFGGWVDAIVQRIVDAWLAFPWLVILLALSAILGRGLDNVIIALGLGFAFGSARVIRSAVIVVRQEQYILAARSLGCSSFRILWRYVLPNVVAPIIVLATLTLGNAILAEASLSFLGLGVPPPDPSWGSMLQSSARVYMYDAPWLAVAPGVALSLSIFGFNMLGDALRDILDPRLRGG